MRHNVVMAPFLLPDGFQRPPLAAVLREGSLLMEAGRLAGRRVARRRAPVTTEDAVEPVLLIPGFLAGDWSLREMASELRREGFRTYRSTILANTGCTVESALALESRLEDIVERTDARVQIVGHSLGGMIARGLAVRRPDLVSGIVTMGSPMLAPAAHHKSLTRAVEVLTRLNRIGVPRTMGAECVSGNCAALSFSESRERLRPTVSMTNIYSRRDGIVDWRACIDPAGTAVEVRASHIGMALDPRVMDVVVDSLWRQASPWMADVADIA